MISSLLQMLLFGMLGVVIAGSGTQTDWSGGPTAWGPVTDWTDTFYSEEYANWDSFPGNVTLAFQYGIMTTVAEDFNYAHSVYSEDLDGDGDMDVLCTGGSHLSLAWWENSDTAPGAHFDMHLIESGTTRMTSVHSEDLDGDGDLDVVGASGFDGINSTGPFDDHIRWWENGDGSGTLWIEHVIATLSGGFTCAYAEDLDGDGDMDVLGTTLYSDAVFWWENETGTGTTWTWHTIDPYFEQALSVHAEDIDGDGYMDVVCAAPASSGGVIHWWKNVDGSGTSWFEYSVTDDFDGAQSARACDIDLDGDIDILGVAYFAGEIKWWENIGSSTTWIPHLVGAGSRCVYSADLDEDGDTDVLGGGNDWWENEDGSGTSWTLHLLPGDGSSIYAEDMDDDGDIDILSASESGDEISWWALDVYPSNASLESLALDTQGNPCWETINWTAETPSGASVSFQVRASDDYNALGAWSDTLTSPCSLSGILSDGDRYVQYRALLETTAPDSVTPILNDVTISWDPMGIEGSGEPSVMTLLPFSPNPASAPAVRFGLSEPASVEISIFDLSGRLVSKVHKDEYPAGYHDILLGNLFPGIYFCRMISGYFTATQRFVVIE